MNFKRSERVSELLRHEISLWVQSIPDPRVGFVTITGVEITDDLMDAKVFFSVFGSEEERQITSHILTKLVPHLRHLLGRKLESLQRVPVLNFIYDHTPERAQRVVTILNQLSEERKDQPNEELANAPTPTDLRKRPKIKNPGKYRKKIPKYEP